MKRIKTKAIPLEQLARVFDPDSIDELIMDLHDLGEQAKLYRPQKKARRKARR